MFGGHCPFCDTNFRVLVRSTRIYPNFCALLPACSGSRFISGAAPADLLVVVIAFLIVVLACVQTLTGLEHYIQYPLQFAYMLPT